MPRPGPFAALALVLALTAAAGPDTAPTPAEALAAVRTFEANAVASGLNAASPNPGDALARASNVLLRFAQESDAVVVDLGPDSVPWCDLGGGLAGKPLLGERGLLLAAYLSGCIKSQLAAGRQDPNPYEGWVAMLRVYRSLRVREAVRIPEVEALLAHEADGSLHAAADAALARARERLQRRYPNARPQPQT